MTFYKANFIHEISGQVKVHCDQIATHMFCMCCSTVSEKLHIMYKFLMLQYTHGYYNSTISLHNYVLTPDNVIYTETIFTDQPQHENHVTKTSLIHQSMDFTRPLKVCCSAWNQDVSSRSFKSAGVGGFIDQSSLVGVGDQFNNLNSFS